MSSPMTMFKLETMIYASEDGTNSVFTLNPALQKQLDALTAQHPVRYNQLLLSGELSGYLAKLDKQAEEQLALTVRQMQEAEGVTEALKAADQLEWVRRMNSIRSRAEEIIKTELIFV